jgi:hypothetical protein
VKARTAFVEFSVHQAAKDVAGKLTFDRIVRHIDTLADGSLARMDIV